MGVPTVIAADKLGELSPHAEKIATAFGTAITILAVVWPMMQKLIKVMKDPEGPAAQMKKEVDNLRDDMRANTELTQRVLNTNQRLQNTILEREDVREMLHEFKGELVANREEVAGMREYQKSSFERLMKDYEGLGNLARGIKERVVDLEEWKQTMVKAEPKTGTEG